MRAEARDTKRARCGLQVRQDGALHRRPEKHSRARLQSQRRHEKRKRRFLPPATCPARARDRFGLPGYDVSCPVIILRQTSVLSSKFLDRDSRQALTGSSFVMSYQKYSLARGMKTLRAFEMEMRDRRYDSRHVCGLYQDPVSLFPPSTD
jgi:hypothetical protein